MVETRLAIIQAIKEAFLADDEIKAIVNRRVCFSQAGIIPATWMKQGALAISPELAGARNYPTSITNHESFNITVHAYIEDFGDEAALEKLMTLEGHVLRILVNSDNADFDSFNGLASACFWLNTVYPEAHLRNFEGLNEARIRFEYRL